MALQFEIMPVTPFRQNCTLLWDDESGQAVLTDVGGDVAHVLQETAKRQLQLQAVWLTHGHLDHAGGVADLLKQQAVPVWGPHADDGYLLESLPQTTASYASYGFPIAEAFVPDGWLSEGGKLKVGAYEFDVLHIPGHTPGHVVFYCAAEKLLIAGDVLFYESIGRTDFPRGNHQQLLASITQKLWPLGGDTTFLPGHGAHSNFAHERRTNPFVSDMALKNQSVFKSGEIT